MLATHDQERLDVLFRYLQKANQTFLGYPVARDYDYESLHRFLTLSCNNLGDPFQPGTYRLDTREFEREVVDFFARLFNAPPNEYWGYVTNGSTEGNLYGLYLARELYPNGIVYFSEDTHYSV